MSKVQCLVCLSIHLPRWQLNDSHPLFAGLKFQVRETELTAIGSSDSSHDNFIFERPSTTSSPVLVVGGMTGDVCCL